MDRPRFCWVDGSLLPIDAPAVLASDSAFSFGRGCYTTARIRNGCARFAERHAARLVRDARRIGLGELDPKQVLQALEETGRACFGAQTDGIVRVQASRDGAARLHLTALPRPTGAEPATWTALISPLIHEGPMPWSGVKVSNHLLFALASEQAREAGADEALLLDREGYLVEGSRSNVVVAFADGETATPDLARGGVAGVGLEVLNERGAEIRVRHVSGRELTEAIELIAVNAIRGPRPIVALDDRPVGDGRPGPVARHLADCFEAE
jgi:branched-subunit amino acid aminotransferase/4-amino-4-deoxychorismate lyase